MGTGSRQRHISQSQASLGGMFRVETTGGVFSGGKFAGHLLFNLRLKAYKAIDRLAIIGKYLLLVYLYV